MRIIYNDLCIRNAEGKDCEQLATWWNDGSVMAHAGFPNGLGTTAEEIKEQIANDSDDTKRRLIIEYRGTSIGEMSFYVYEGKKVEIGIKICNSDFQGKGLGRVILSMLIEKLFSTGYELIFLDTNLKNTRGWRCTICGYVYEGEELPPDFICPLCKHGVEDFEKIV